jgi:hypothetical protein
MTGSLTGLYDSIFEMMNLKSAAPDHSSPSLRMVCFDVRLTVEPAKDEPAPRGGWFDRRRRSASGLYINIEVVTVCFQAIFPLKVLQKS